MPKWLPVIPSLYTMASSADIISTLTAHGMIIERGNQGKPTSGSSNTVLAAREKVACTNTNCKAKKRSTHTTDDCYWPGGGKEGQFPLNFGQRSWANIAAPNKENTEHFVLSAHIPDTPGNSGVILDESINHIPPLSLVSKGFQTFGTDKIPTFMDSGASDTMFVSRDAFIEYKVITPRQGDSAKAVDGDFEIIGEGKVTQRYLVENKEKEITYTHVLHTPTLSANLILISAFDKAGLTTTFGGGRGIICKKDGTVVLTGRGEKGMYIVDTINTLGSTGLPGNPTAMRSLSQPTSLEQWHRRLTHCSPLTIKEMANGKLVDGLTISEDHIRGKCEDCILGRQTRRPFDGETEKTLDPLELVAFDLWGPSRVQSGGGKLYFMPIVDAGTSYKHGAYLCDKSDASTISAFDLFRVKAESMTGKKIR